MRTMRSLLLCILCTGSTFSLFAGWSHTIESTLSSRLDAAALATSSSAGGTNADWGMSTDMGEFMGNTRTQFGVIADFTNNYQWDAPPNGSTRPTITSQHFLVRFGVVHDGSPIHVAFGSQASGPKYKIFLSCNTSIARRDSNNTARAIVKRVQNGSEIDLCNMIAPLPTQSFTSAQDRNPDNPYWILYSNGRITGGYGDVGTNILFDCTDSSPLITLNTDKVGFTSTQSWFEFAVRYLTNADGTRGTATNNLLYTPLTESQVNQIIPTFRMLSSRNNSTHFDLPNTFNNSGSIDDQVTTFWARSQDSFQLQLGNSSDPDNYATIAITPPAFADSNIIETPYWVHVKKVDGGSNQEITAGIGLHPGSNVIHRSRRSGAASSSPTRATFRYINSSTEKTISVSRLQSIGLQTSAETFIHGTQIERVYPARQSASLAPEKIAAPEHALGINNHSSIPVYNWHDTWRLQNGGTVEFNYSNRNRDGLEIVLHRERANSFNQAKDPNGSDRPAIDGHTSGWTYKALFDGNTLKIYKRQPWRYTQESWENWTESLTYDRAETPNPDMLVKWRESENPVLTASLDIPTESQLLNGGEHLWFRVEKTTLLIGGFLADGTEHTFGQVTIPDLEEMTHFTFGKRDNKQEVVYAILPPPPIDPAKTIILRAGEKGQLYDKHTLVTENQVMLTATMQNLDTTQTEGAAILALSNGTNSRYIFSLYYNKETKGGNIYVTRPEGPQEEALRVKAFEDLPDDHGLARFMNGEAVPFWLCYYNGAFMIGIDTQPGVDPLWMYVDPAPHTDITRLKFERWNISIRYDSISHRNLDNLSTTFPAVTTYDGSHLYIPLAATGRGMITFNSTTNFDSFYGELYAANHDLQTAQPGYRFTFQAGLESTVSLTHTNQPEGTIPRGNLEMLNGSVLFPQPTQTGNLYEYTVLFEDGKVALFKGTTEQAIPTVNNLIYAWENDSAAPMYQPDFDGLRFFALSRQLKETTFSSITTTPAAPDSINWRDLITAFNQPYGITQNDDESFLLHHCHSSVHIANRQQDWKHIWQPTSSENFSFNLEYAADKSSDHLNIFLSDKAQGLPLLRLTVLEESVLLGRLMANGEYHTMKRTTFNLSALKSGIINVDVKQKDNEIIVNNNDGGLIAEFNIDMPDDTPSHALADLAPLGFITFSNLHAGITISNISGLFYGDEPMIKDAGSESFWAAVSLEGQGQMLNPGVTITATLSSSDGPQAYRLTQRSDSATQMLGYRLEKTTDGTTYTTVAEQEDFPVVPGLASGRWLVNGEGSLFIEYEKGIFNISHGGSRSVITWSAHDPDPLPGITRAHFTTSDNVSVSGTSVEAITEFAPKIIQSADGLRPSCLLPINLARTAYTFNRESSSAPTRIQLHTADGTPAYTLTLAADQTSSTKPLSVSLQSESILNESGTATKMVLDTSDATPSSWWLAVQDDSVAFGSTISGTQTTEFLLPRAATDSALTMASLTFPEGSGMLSEIEAVSIPAPLLSDPETTSASLGGWQTEDGNYRGYGMNNEVTYADRDKNWQYRLQSSQLDTIDISWSLAIGPNGSGSVHLSNTAQGVAPIQVIINETTAHVTNTAGDDLATWSRDLGLNPRLRVTYNSSKELSLSKLALDGTPEWTEHVTIADAPDGIAYVTFSSGPTDTQHNSIQLAHNVAEQAAALPAGQPAQWNSSHRLPTVNDGLITGTIDASSRATTIIELSSTSRIVAQTSTPELRAFYRIRLTPNQSAGTVTTDLERLEGSRYITVAGPTTKQVSLADGLPFWISYRNGTLRVGSDITILLEYTDQAPHDGINRAGFMSESADATITDISCRDYPTTIVAESAYYEGSVPITPLFAPAPDALVMTGTLSIPTDQDRATIMFEMSSAQPRADQFKDHPSGGTVYQQVYVLDLVTRGPGLSNQGRIMIFKHDPDIDGKPNRSRDVMLEKYIEYADESDHPFIALNNGESVPFKITFDHGSLWLSMGSDNRTIVSFVDPEPQSGVVRIIPSSYLSIIRYEDLALSSSPYSVYAQELQSIKWHDAHQLTTENSGLITGSFAHAGQRPVGAARIHLAEAANSTGYQLSFSYQQGQSTATVSLDKVAADGSPSSTLNSATIAATPEIQNWLTGNTLPFWLNYSEGAIVFGFGAGQDIGMVPLLTHTDSTAPTITRAGFSSERSTILFTKLVFAPSITTITRVNLTSSLPLRSGEQTPALQTEHPLFTWQQALSAAPSSPLDITLYSEGMAAYTISLGAWSNTGMALTVNSNRFDDGYAPRDGTGNFTHYRTPAGSYEPGADIAWEFGDSSARPTIAITEPVGQQTLLNTTPDQNKSYWLLVTQTADEHLLIAIGSGTDRLTPETAGFVWRSPSPVPASSIPNRIRISSGDNALTLSNVVNRTLNSTERGTIDALAQMGTLVDTQIKNLIDLYRTVTVAADGTSSWNDKHLFAANDGSVTGTLVPSEDTALSTVQFILASDEQNTDPNTQDAYPFTPRYKVNVRPSYGSDGALVTFYKWNGREETLLQRTELSGEELTASHPLTLLRAQQEQPFLLNVKNNFFTLRMGMGSNVAELLSFTDSNTPHTVTRVGFDATQGPLSFTQITMSAGQDLTPLTTPADDTTDGTTGDKTTDEQGPNEQDSGEETDTTQEATTPNDQTDTETEEPEEVIDDSGLVVPVSDTLNSFTVYQFSPTTTNRDLDPSQLPASYKWSHTALKETYEKQYGFSLTTDVRILDSHEQGGYITFGFEERTARRSETDDVITQLGINGGLQGFNRATYNIMILTQRDNNELTVFLYGANEATDATQLNNTSGIPLYHSTAVNAQSLYDGTYTFHIDVTPPDENGNYSNGPLFSLKIAPRGNDTLWHDITPSWTWSPTRPEEKARPHKFSRVSMSAWMADISYRNITVDPVPAPDGTPIPEPEPEPEPVPEEEEEPAEETPVDTSIALGQAGTFNWEQELLSATTLDVNGGGYLETDISLDQLGHVAEIALSSSADTQEPEYILQIWPTNSPSTSSMTMYRLVPGVDGAPARRDVIEVISNNQTNVTADAKEMTSALFGTQRSRIWIRYVPFNGMPDGDERRFYLGMNSEPTTANAVISWKDDQVADDAPALTSFGVGARQSSPAITYHIQNVVSTPMTPETQAVIDQAIAEEESLNNATERHTLNLTDDLPISEFWTQEDEINRITGSASSPGTLDFTLNGEPEDKVTLAFTHTSLPRGEEEYTAEGLPNIDFWVTFTDDRIEIYKAGKAEPETHSNVGGLASSGRNYRLQIKYERRDNKLYGEFSIWSGPLECISWQDEILDVDSVTNIKPWYFTVGHTLGAGATVASSGQGAYNTTVSDEAKQILNQSVSFNRYAITG